MLFLLFYCLFWIEGAVAECYAGTDPPICSTCGGACETNTGCTCFNGTSCIPTECLLNTDNCCPSGFYWNLSLSCCTDSAQCNPQCAGDEICSTINGEPTCVCNNQTYQNNLPADVVPLITCYGDKIIVSVSQCLLEALHYDYTDIHLDDVSDSCTNVYTTINNNIRMQNIDIIPKTGWCGNTVMIDSAKVYYSNTLNISGGQFPIITVNPLYFNVTCGYNLTAQIALSIPINVTTCSKAQLQDYTPVAVNSETESSKSILFKNTMAIYTDPTYVTPLGNNEAYVLQDLYVGLLSYYVDTEEFTMRVENCIATPDGDVTSVNKVQLVSGGCPADEGVYLKILTNGISSEARMLFKAFSFTGFPLVYITCELSYCNRQNNCSMCKENNMTIQEASLNLSGGGDTVCYNGSIAACNTCNGDCSSGQCFCSDQFTQCVPTAGECDLGTNDCCPSGYFYDSNAACCTDRAICNPPCADDEYCAEGTCVCNKTLYKDKTTADLNPSVACYPDVMLMTMSSCLLSALGLDYVQLNLVDNSSSCIQYPYYILGNQKMQEIQIIPQDGWCGNVMTVDDNYFYYSNIISIGIQDTNLITAYPVTFQVTCAYKRIDQIALNYTLHPVTSTIHMSLCQFPQENITSLKSLSTSYSSNSSVYNWSSGDVNPPALYNDTCNIKSCCMRLPPAIVTGSYDISIVPYVDEELTERITEDTIVVVGSNIYLSLSSYSIYSQSPILRVEQCFASPQENPEDLNRINLIYRGCANNSEVYTEILENGLSENAKISFMAFQFTGFTDVYIFCQTMLCTYNEDCTQCSVTPDTTTETPTQLKTGVCYTGSIPMCSSCNGDCSSGQCFCSDQFTSCVPTAGECELGTNDCCPSGYFYDSSAVCCTDKIICNPSCTDDEYCAKGTCVCNKTIFQDKTIANSIQVNCNYDVMTVSVSKCLLEYLGYNYSSIHPCSPTYDTFENGQHLVAIQLLLLTGWCGNNVTNDSSNIYYTNRLFIDPLNKPVITVSPVILNFTCAYSRIMKTSLQVPLNIAACETYGGNISQALTSMDSIFQSTTMAPNTTFIATGNPASENLSLCNDSKCCFTGSNKEAMAAYKDSSLTMPVLENNVVSVGSDIYLQIFTLYQNEISVLKVTQCIAAPVNDKSYPNKLQLLKDGCPVFLGKSIEVLGNGVSNEARIKINAFQFQGYAHLFVFCDVELCIENCSVTCNNDGPDSNAFQLSSVTGIVTSMTTCPKDEQCVVTGGIETCECNNTALTNASLENTIVAVTCEAKSMTVALKECLLVQLGYNPLSVQLDKNDSWCSVVSSQVLNDTRIYTLEVKPYTGCCGNTIMVNSTHMTYSNTLHIKSISTSSGERAVNISCSYSMFWESQLLLSVQQENGMLTVSEVFACSDLLCASIYKDDQSTHLLFNGESLEENSTLFIVINTSLQDSDRFHIVVDQLFISSLNDSLSSSYRLIMQNGVTYDPQFQLLSNWTTTEARFSVQTTFFTDQFQTSLFFTARLCDSYTEQCCKFILNLLQGFYIRYYDSRSKSF